MPRGALWFTAVLVAAVVLWFASHVVLLLFAAALFAIFLRGLSHWTEETLGVPELWALALVTLALAASATGVLWLLVPPIAAQVDQLLDVLPETFQRYTSVLRQYEWGTWLLDRTVGSQGGDNGANILSSGVGIVGGAVSSTIGAIVQFVLTIIIGLYLAAEARLYTHGFLKLIPHRKRDRMAEVLEVSAHSLRGWLTGKICSMVLLGVLSFIGLWLLEVRLALTMAVLTALLAFIPNLGAILSVIPPVLLALADSPWKALYVLIFYVAVQNVESVFLTPMIQRRAASLPPALLMGAQLFMAVVFGSLGLLLAAPLAVLGMVWVQMLYVEDFLGEPPAAEEHGRSQQTAPAPSHSG